MRRATWHQRDVRSDSGAEPYGWHARGVQRDVGSATARTCVTGPAADALARRDIALRAGFGRLEIAAYLLFRMRRRPGARGANAAVVVAPAASAVAQQAEHDTPLHDSCFLRLGEIVRAPRLLGEHLSRIWSGAGQIKVEARMRRGAGDPAGEIVGRDGR